MDAVDNCLQVTVAFVSTRAFGKSIGCIPNGIAFKLVHGTFWIQSMADQEVLIDLFYEVGDHEKIAIPIHTYRIGKGCRDTGLAESFIGKARSQVGFIPISIGDIDFSDTVLAFGNQEIISAVEVEFKILFWTEIG